MAMVAISRDDLDRIVSSVHGNQSSAGSCTVPRRQQLKHLSDSRVAGWTDTLVAKRKAKLDWKAEKERQDEEARKVQDAKDAERRMRVRTEALEHADGLVREQTEKMRQFRSQQMLVEAIDTRDSQLKEQEEKRKQENAMEELWHIAVMENIKKAEEKSKRDMEQEKQRSLKLADELRQQREEREERMRVQQQRKREEEMNTIKKLAMDDSAVEKAKIKEKNDRRIKLKQSMEETQSVLNKRQEEIQKRELEETRKCEEEAAKRDKLNAARAELEIKHFEQKQAHKKLLSHKASEELKLRAMRECEIFERDVRLRNQKARERAEAAQRRLEAERAAIDESRKQQLQRKVREKEAEKKLGELYAKELARINEQQQDTERRKELAKRRQNIELRNMQRQQIRENERSQAEEKEDALKEEQQVFDDLKKEDDVFKDFVAKEIEKFKVQGKRTALLEKALVS